MMSRFLAALAFICVAVMPAGAHTRSQSFSSWTVGETTLEGVYQVDAYRVTQLSETPEDLAKLLLAHLETRLSATQAGAACARAPLRPLAAPRGDMRVEVRFTCPRPIGAADVQLRVGGFFDVSISHVHYARLDYADGRTDEVVLTQGQQVVVAGASGAQVHNGFASLVLLGFEHVLSGLDHLAFLVALMLLAGSFRQTVWAVTGFTLGHSLTLALVALGILRPDTAAIEAIIGFTVAWAAGDALARVRGISPIAGLAGAVGVAGLGLAGAVGGLLQVPLGVMLGLAVFAGASAFARGASAGWVAPAVASIFGLAHGAGFAGPLLELQIAPGDIAWTLLAFNIGVEAAQLLAVGTALGLVEGLRRVKGFPPAIALDGLAALLFALGTFWFVSRALG